MRNLFIQICKQAKWLASNNKLSQKYNLSTRNKHYLAVRILTFYGVMLEMFSKRPQFVFYS